MRKPAEKHGKEKHGMTASAAKKFSCAKKNFLAENYIPG